MAQRSERENPSGSMLDELKSCPQVMQELAKALLPSLKELAGGNQSRNQGRSGHVPHGLSHINEAYLDPDSGNEACSDVDYQDLGNEAYYGLVPSTGKEARTIQGNEANSGYGNEARNGHGNEARYNLGNEARNNIGNEARNTLSNEARNYLGKETRNDRGRGHNADDATPSSAQAGQNQWGWAGYADPGWTGADASAAYGSQVRPPYPPHTGYWQFPPSYGQNQGMFPGFPPWPVDPRAYQPPIDPVRTTSPRENRKRSRPEEDPSTSSATEVSEDDIDPFISGRERRELLSSSDESDEGEEERQPPAKRSFTPTEETRKFLRSVALKPLKNEKRKDTMNKYPIPACDPIHPPKLDESVSCLVPKTAKTYDSFLSKLQRFALDAAGPLVWMLNERSQGREVDVDLVCKSTLALLGNASAHFNVERRRSLLKHLNKDLRPLAEAEFPERGAYLFGDDFGKRAKKMSDNVSALKGLTKKNTDYNHRFSGSGDPNRRFNLPKPQGRRPNWGVTPPIRRSVFGRLDPAPKIFHKFRKPSKQQREQNK